MAFGNISTLYLPTAANSGASQRGTNVRKLLSAADAGADATTTANMGTGGAITITLNPYASATTNPSADTLGWMVTPSDMGGSSGARRFYPAGNHVLTCSLVNNNAVADTATVKLSAYSIGPTPSFTPTLLGSATNTGSVSSLGQTVVAVTLALAEIIFAVGETIQYSVELSGSGAAVLGRIYTFATGTNGANSIRVDTPKLGVLADTVAAASGTGTAASVTGKILGTVGSPSGQSTVSGVLGATSGTVASVTGTGTAAGAGSSVAGTKASASGSSTVNGVGGKVVGTVGTVAPAGGSTTIRPIQIFDP